MPQPTTTPRRYRFREYRLVPDTEPGAEPVMVAAQCCICDQGSELSWDADEAGRWCLNHLETNPDHFTYRALTSRPVRAQPGEWL